MIRLDDALHTLGLSGKSELEGTWVTLAGERCRVYVMGTRWGQRYYTWCDDPHDRTVEMYDDPIAALQAGLRRAARLERARGSYDEIAPRDVCDGQSNREDQQCGYRTRSRS